MKETIFLETEFVALIVSSLVIPIGIYFNLFRERVISRKTVLAFAIFLITLSGVDVVLLQNIASMTKETLSTFDDKLFASGLSVALYILPAVFAGIAINLMSHLLNKHLDEAEKRYEEQPARQSLKLNLQLIHVSKRQVPF